MTLTTVSTTVLYSNCDLIVTLAVAAIAERLVYILDVSKCTPLKTDKMS